MPAKTSGAKGARHPLRVVEEKDPETGARLTRYEHARGDAQIFYYSSPGFTRDGRFVPCWASVSGDWQIHAIDRREQVSLQLTEGPSTFDPDAPCLDPDRACVFYRSGAFIRRVDLRSLEDDWLFEIPQGFCGLHLASNRDFLVFSFFEEFPVGRTRDGREIGGGRAVLHYRPRSILVSIRIEDGAAEHVWGDHNFLTHVGIAPWNSDFVLFADQSWPNRQQELFIVSRGFVEAKQPLQLFTGLGLNYVGHAWFTQDGYVAAQHAHYFNADRLHRFTDAVYANAISRPDGTSVRLARFPGDKKPTHCHAQRADGLWVGDGWVRPDGVCDHGWLALMINRFETQEMEIHPFLRTGHIWHRPFHPHPWISWDEREVVFAAHAGGRNHVCVAKIPEPILRRVPPPP